MRIGGTLVVLTMLIVGRPAWSQTCNASATGEAFGTYNPFNAGATTSTATVTVTCQAAVSILVSYSIALDGGTSGVITARSMANGSVRLPYQLYKDVLHTQLWGDGTGGSSPVTDGYLLGVLTPVVHYYPAYGIIPAGSQVAPGIYGDLITVMLSY